MRLLAPTVVVALVALAAADDAEPVCAKTCIIPGDSSSGFQAGHQYVYMYRGEASTSTSTDNHQQQQQQSPLSVLARVVVTAGASPCDLRMQIPSMEVQGDSVWLKEAVQAHDLYFSYQSGRVEELCPHAEEVTAATNFKRAVLSSLHTSMSLTNPKDRMVLHETDVAGECRTEYSLISRMEDRLVFNKTKNDCLSQHILLPHLPHTPAPFTLPSATPFFRSNQECEMESERGVWQSVTCKQHVKVDGPLTPSGGPVTFTLSSGLVLETSRPDGSMSFFHQEHWTRRESLRMNLEEDSEARQTQETSNIMAQVASTIDGLLRGQEKQEQPRLFSHLVGLLSHLDHQDLQDAWSTYTTTQNHKAIMLDSLLACDAGPCVALVTQLANDEPSTLPLASLTSWLAAVHLQSQADPMAITHIMGLVQNRPDVEEAAVMAASSVVFRVCQKDPKGCHSHSQVFLKYVRQEVGEGCGWGQDRQEQQRVKFALQALGNTGVIPKDNFPQRCYKNKLLPTELRVAALQALRRAGCSSSEAPWAVLEDRKDKVEVRLAAYLALQPCISATAHFFPRLQALLEREEVNQVGSFIWTHVRNLAEQPGSSQGEQEVAHLASQLTLNNKFNTNAFQASRNYRLAQFSDTHGMGGIADADVIFTPESYLPRTAAFNLTLQLLGKSVNLFEIGSNFKGLEDYVEKFFGKGSYFENEEIQKLLQNLRPKREAIKDKLEEYQALYDKAKGKKEDAEGEEEEPSASMYLRVFGSEVMHSENILKLDPLKAIQEAFQQLSSHRSFQIMNQEFVAPTLLGFPLRLKCNVSGSLSLGKEGRFEVVGPGQMLLEGQLSPTVTVAADETLLLDGYGSYSGIRRSTTHHAHSKLGGKVSIHNWELIDAQLDLPETEVMKVHSSMKVAVYSNAEQGWSEAAAHTQQPQETKGCSSQALSDTVGLQVCHKESTGSSATVNIYEKQIVVSKSDSFDKFVFSFRKSDSSMEAVFDTPDSSVNRRTSITVDSQADGIGGSVVTPGRQIEGQYQWSMALKRMALKYYKDSEPQAELDASLQSLREGPSTKHTSRLVVSLPGVWEVRANGSVLQSPNSLSWEATCMSSFQGDPATTQGKWEVADGQHRASARAVMGQNFATASGSVLCEAGLTVVDGKCEYGRDAAEPNTLTLSARFAEKMVNRGKALEGQLSVQSSQAGASLNLEIEQQPGNTAANASLSYNGAEINSTLVSKNIGEEGKRDFEVAFSVFSKQLALDYLGRALYKISDGALQVEAEARLGALGHARVSLSHLLQGQPFHALAGLHLQLNDHLLQASYNVDLSKPGHNEIMVSGAVGAASAGFYAEVEHSPTRPFQMHMKMFGGQGSQQGGITLATTSDSLWQTFSGSMELTWFGWSSEVRHETFWSDTRKEINVFSGQESFQLMYKTSPSPQVQLLVKSGMNPTFQVFIGKMEDTRSEIYQAYIKHRTEEPLHISATWNKDQSFNGNLKLLESELQVSGSLTQPNRDQLEGSAEVTIILPNRQTSTTQLTFSHAYDGTTRDYNVSSTSNGQTYEGQFRLQQRQGWFSNDSLSLSVNVTTPIDNLRSVALVLETHSDPSLVDFIQLEVEGVKIRGEAQVGDPSNLFDVKLQLESDGSVCESRAHLYHKFVNGTYLTGAYLRPTWKHDPWDFRAITNLNYMLNRKSVEVEFGSPLWSSPFNLLANYSRSEHHFDLKLHGGAERQASIAVSGNSDHQGNTRVLGGMLEVVSPWTSLVLVNVSHQCGENGLNTSLDLQTSWQPLNNVKADFTFKFVNASDLEAHFQLNHEQVQISMDLSHRFTKGGLSSQVEVSVNTARATGKAVCTWDENFVPQSATGHLGLVNVLSDPFDFNLSLIKGISDFHTQILGSLGNHQVRMDHQLRVNHIMDWVSILTVVLPNREDVMESEMTVNILPDLSSMKVKFSADSPWTEAMKLDLSSQKVDALRETKFSASYGDSTIAELMLEMPEPFHWYQADVNLNISSHFPSLDIHWKYKFGEESQATLEIFVDDEFYLKGEQKLVLSRNRLTRKFEEFHFTLSLSIPSNGFDFETKLALHSDFRGEFQAESGDYLVQVTAFPKTGEVFTFASEDPLHEWTAALSYASDVSSLPDLIFSVAKDDKNIFKIESKFTEVYPKLDGSFKFEVTLDNYNSPKHGQLHLTADLSKIQEYAFKGSAALESNFEGFTKYSLELDSYVNNEGSSVDGRLVGTVHINDWQYRTDLFGSLEMGPRNFSLIYRTEYILMRQQQVLDRKEVDMVFHANETRYMGNITVTTGPQAPQWAFFMSYNHEMKEFKAHVMPGNGRKYQAMARLDANVFKVDSQIVSEDGQPPFKVIAGDVSWTLRRRRRLIKVDLSSDFRLVQSIKGVIGIQRRRRVAIGAKLMINEKELSGNVTYIPTGPRIPGRVSVELKNEVFVPFKTNMNLKYAMTPGGAESSLSVDLNDTKNWVFVDAKGSLPESYITLNLPYKDFENITVSLKLSASPPWGLIVSVITPKLCFNLEGSLSPESGGFLSANILEACNKELFDFQFRYEYSRDFFNFTSHCRLQKYGLIYKVAAEGEVEGLFQLHLKVKTQIYNIFSLGFEFSSVSIDDEKEEGWSLMIHAYNDTSKWTHFLYTLKVTENQTIISTKVNERALLSLKAFYDVQDNGFDVNGTVSHSLFYLPFSATVTATGKLEEREVDVDIGLSTSSQVFPQADFLLNYKITENRVGTVKVSSTLGSAEATMVLQEASDKNSITFDMTSSLHSFQEYHIELTHRREGNSHHISAVSMQDDLELELQGALLDKIDGFQASLNIRTPFRALETLHVTLGYPNLDAFEGRYTVDIHGLVNGYTYGVTCSHEHDDSWHRQKTRLVVITTEEGFGNFSLSAEYDVSSHATVLLGTSEGDMSLGATWEDFRTHFILNLNLNLAQFGLGEYSLHSDIARSSQRSQRSETVRLEYSQSPVNYTCQLTRGRNMNMMKLSVDINNPTWAANKTAYSLSYDLYARKNLLQLEGQYKNMTASTTIMPKNMMSPLLGSFEIQTNIDGYEVMNGSWNIARQSDVYLTKAKLDINNQTMLSFTGQLDTQPQGASASWRELELDIQLESALTLPHHLHAECDISAWSLSSTYKHGLDHFHLKILPRLRQKVGTLLLTGNVPIRGMSTFTLDLSYKLKEVYSASLTVSIEETHLMTSMELEPRKSWSSLKASLTSPYFKPLRASLLWTFKEQPWLVESTVAYGTTTGELKISAQPYGNLKHLDVQLNLPFECFYKGLMMTKYSMSQAGQVQASTGLVFNNHTLNAEAKAKYNNNIKMEFLSSGNICGTEGALELKYDRVGNHHTGKASVNWGGQTVFSTSFIADPEKVELDMKKGASSYLSAKITFSQVEVKFLWNDAKYFNMSGSLTPLNDNYSLELRVESSEMQPMLLRADASTGGSHEGLGFLRIGEREYNVTVRGNANKMKLNVELRLQSSDNPYMPINFKAQYNFKEYFRGRTSSLVDLASVTLDWGGTIKLVVKGMQSRSQSKMKFEIITPIRSLPKLNFGYDSQFSLARSSVDIMCTIYAEWSQKVTFTSFFKLMDKELDLFLGLTSSYSSLEVFDVSLKTSSDRVEAEMTLNKDKWSVTCDYQLVPFSATLTLNTPLENYKTLSMAASGTVQRGHLSGEVEFKWTDTIKVQIEAELWELEVKLYTPWEPVMEAFLKASLRTESEALKVTAAGGWGESSITMETLYSPQQLKIEAAYNEEAQEVGIIVFEIALPASRKYKVSLQGRTPFISLESLTMEFTIRPKNHEYMIMFKTSNSEHVLELMASRKQGKLRVDLPTLGKFTWTMEAKNSWLKLNSELSLSLGGASVPVTASLSYHISPDDEQANMSIKAEFPNQWMESLNLSASIDYDDISMKASTALVWKLRYEEPSNFTANLTSSVSKKHISMQLKVESDCFEYPIEVTCVSPLFNPLMRDTTVELVLVYGDSYKLLYKTQNEDNRGTVHEFTMDIPWWSFAVELNLQDDTFNASVSFPGMSDQYFLIIQWPQTSLEHFNMSIELHHPRLPTEGIKISTSFKALRKFSFLLSLETSYGQKSISASGTLQYVKKLSQVNCEGTVTSNWIGDHSLEANIQWLRNTRASIKLKTAAEEHNCSLVVDVMRNTLELNCSSPWLPYGKVSIRGKVNTDMSITKVEAEGQLEGFMEGEKLDIMAKVSKEDDSGPTTAEMTVEQGQEVLLSLFSEVTLRENSLVINFDSHSTKSWLRTSFYLHLEDNNEKRYLFTSLSNNHYIPYTTLNIENNKNWRREQSIRFVSSKYEFRISSEVRKQAGSFKFNIKLSNFNFKVSSTYSLSDKYFFKFYVDTSMDAVQSLAFVVHFPGNDSKTELLEFYFRGCNDQEGKLVVHTFPDPVMRWSVWASLTTPFSGFEKLKIMTPQFAYEDHIFRAYVEYPGDKIGIILSSRDRSRPSTGMQFSVYLPFEKYDIISMKVVDRDMSFKGYYGVEMRVGNLGFTMSVSDASYRDMTKIELLFRLNEWTIKTCLMSIWERGRGKIQIDLPSLSSRYLVGAQSFSAQWRYNEDEEFYFAVKRDSQEMLKAHFSWGTDKIFSLTTPRMYPGHVVFHLESSVAVQECQLMVTLATGAGGSGQPHGFHVHHRRLEAGHHISLLGLSPKRQVRLDGMHHLSHKLLNESLVIEVDKKQVGYTVFLKGEPGLVRTTCSGGMFLQLPVHSIRLSSRLDRAMRQIGFSSQLTWGTGKSSRKPLNFNLKYNDYSILGKGRHHLQAVLSHPDSQDVTLHANLTRALNSSLHGSAELVDGNSPEMKVVARLMAGPAGQDGRHSMSLSLSQPASNLGVLVDAQLQQASPHSEALCRLSYYSLTSEAWHHLNLSASLEAEGGKHEATVAVAVPEVGWGRTWQGVVVGQPGEVSISVEGGTDGPGDTWRLGAVVTKRLPELQVYVGVGREEEVQREARVRLGLHSPMEAGAALDHFSFGQWKQDAAAAGLRLTSPHILQAFLQFDPSLDYNATDFMHRLMMPMPRLLYVWQQEAITTMQSVKQWMQTELPSLSGVLINRQVLEMVWKSESANLNNFLTEAEQVFSGVTSQGSLLWQEHLWPRLQQGLRLISTAHEWVQERLDHGLYDMSRLLQQWTYAAQLRWRTVSYQVASLEYSIKAWWSRTEVAVESWLQWTMYRATRTINVAMAIVRDWTAAHMATLRPHWEAATWAMERYWQELSSTVMSECWWPVRIAASQLERSLGQTLQSSWPTVRAFLQPEKTLPPLYKAWHTTIAWAQQTLTSIQAGLQQLGASVQGSIHFTFPHHLYNALETAWERSQPIFSDLAQNGVSGVVAHITSAMDSALAFLGRQVRVLQARPSESVLCDYLKAFAGGAYDKLLVMWQNWKEQDYTDKATINMMRGAVMRMLNLEDDVFMESYVFEPVVEGRILYNQHLPVTWPSFLHTPLWHELGWESGVDETQRILRDGVEMPSSSRGALWLPGSLLPPFTATAVITGQHITTFDLDHYQFLGPCSYVLTRDFVGGDFTVVGMYQAEAGMVRLASIQVLTPSRNFVLSMNGSVDAAQPHAEVHSAEGRTSLKVGSLLVSCDQVTQSCSISVSSKYFGRLAGLLGNYNNEPSDDRRGSSGQPASSPAQLATWWAVGDKPCYQANQAVEVNVTTAGLDVKECSQLFLKTDSPLSACFYSVNPRPYFSQCLGSAVHGQGEGNRGSLCGAAAAYTTQCLARGLSLPQPSQCRRGGEKRGNLEGPVLSGSCEVPGGEPVPSRWSKTFRGETQGSADIAFIVELANCNKGKNLQQLLQLLKVHMRRAGTEDVRYALLTVQEGSEGQPSAFMGEADMLALLSTLDLQGPKDDLGGAAAIVSAAKHLKWRPGVSRTIIQLSCRPCDAGNMVHQALQENDVSFHLVTKHKVTMAGPNPKKRDAMAKKLLGFDDKFGYTVKDIKKFAGTEKLRTALQEPEGSCVVAAQASGGSVFNMNKWLPSKEVLAKKFLRVLSHRVAMSSAAPECQNCQCLGGAMDMKLQCQKCSSDFSVAVEEAERGPELAESPAAKRNYTIKADIKKDFIQQYIISNDELSGFRTESDLRNLEDEEEEGEDQSMSSEEEEEEEEVEEEEGNEEEYEEYEDGQNYENYEEDY